MSDKLKKLIKECIRSILSENTEYPTNWNVGFYPINTDSKIKLMNGETPFKIGDRWYLYVWDMEKNDNAVYDYASDMLIDYSDFQDKLEQMRKPKLNEKSKKSDEEKRRASARRKAEIDAGVYGQHKPKVIQPKKGGYKRHSKHKGQDTY